MPLVLWVALALASLSLWWDAVGRRRSALTWSVSSALAEALDAAFTATPGVTVAMTATNSMQHRSV